MNSTERGEWLSGCNEETDDLGRTGEPEDDYLVRLWIDWQFGARPNETFPQWMERAQRSA